MGKIFFPSLKLQETSTMGTEHSLNCESIQVLFSKSLEMACPRGILSDPKTFIPMLIRRENINNISYRSSGSEVENGDW